MSRLRKYELSLWRDSFENGEPKEQKMYVFGSDELDTQARAIEPKLKRNVNGSNELTFKLYYQYIDNVTGKLVQNPYVRDLVNEAKIKLLFKNKWYDFIIKSLDKNSSNHIISYTATDLHINELSKNGFGLTLSNELENSIGTVQELGERIFEDTDWNVDASEKIPQTLDESLIEVTLAKKLTIEATQLLNSKTITPLEQKVSLSIPEEAKLYLFYSCCKNESDRLQFIYIPKPQSISKDQDRIIVNTNCQYYIDNVIYTSSPAAQRYGLKIPKIFPINQFDISTDYRGRRYVFTQKTNYNKILKKYVKEYYDSEKKRVCGYTTTEYVAPNIIQNYITNNTFKQTSGWQGGYSVLTTDKTELHNKVDTWGATVSTGTTPDIIEELVDGSFAQDTVYQPYLEIKFKPNIDTEGLVVNSSFYDQRTNFKGFFPRQKYVLLYCQQQIRGETAELQFKTEVGERLFVTATGTYEKDYNYLFLTFDSTQSLPYPNPINEQSGYRYIIAEVPEKIVLTEDEYKRLKIQTFISLKDGSSSTGTAFFDFQIFPYYEKEDGVGFMLPTDQVVEAQALNTYSYFYPDIENNKNASTPEEMLIVNSNTPWENLKISYNIGAEKVNTLQISKSNYFNACQKLCETFECWADFDIQHDEEGYILDKTVRFKNYIGKNNYAGFRYGVNLKSISRKDDSKKIVSKLLVTDNTNEHAKNGMCTIARAGSNETKENYIYDFSYYINQGMINVKELSSLLYNTDNGCGKDLVLINNKHAGISQPLNCQGYYTRLAALNTEIDKIAGIIVEFSVPLMKAQADVTTNEAGLEAADSELNTNIESFRQVAGFEYTNIKVTALDLPGATATELFEENKRREELVNSNLTIKGYLTKIAELWSARSEYEKQLASSQATLLQYQEKLNTLEKERQQFLEWKKQLNKLFFKKYYRYIQEGTWTDGNQIDDEKYYIDAQSVAYNSCMPQVTYTFSILAIEHLSGYEGISFDLADKTYVEDEEYFGYDEEGNPYREEVVVTEITYFLEEVDKDTISVRNHKNQFQDLFQTITASVQSVNYTSGAWNKAAAFTESSDKEKSDFLQGALNHVDTVLTNAGEQSVVWDSSGITITDKSKPSQQVRLIAGGIFLRDKDGGGLGWKAGITADGINAKLITSGQINTSVIQIMRGDEPYFRWDDHGITAYSFDENDKNIVTNYDSKRGVRFDRFGIYGYDMTDEHFIPTSGIKDGQIWHPRDTEEIRNSSIFSLTWEGLQLRPGSGYYGRTEKTKHISYALFGKTDGKVYVGWDNWYTPITHISQCDPFVKILSAGTQEGDKLNEKLAIYDNGVIVCQDARLRGTIYAESGRIGSEEAGWKIDANSITTGTLGTDGFHMFADGKQDKIITIGDSPDKTDWKLVIGSNFGVDTEGRLFASDVMLSGTITATAGGNIGGWNIGDNYLISENEIGTDDSYHMYSKDKSPKKKIGNSSELETWRLVIGSKFGVDSGGNLFATNVNLTGIIHANAGGTIGGWAIGERSLIAENEKFFMYSIGESIIKQIGNSSVKSNWRLIIGDNFGVDSEGILHATDAVIDGQITVGEGATIAGWEVTKNSLTYGQIGTANSFWMISEDKEDNPSCSIGDSGDKSDWRLVIGNSFGVNKDGILYATNANITGNVSIGEGATIAGWKVSGNELAHTWTDSEGNQYELGLKSASSDSEDILYVKKSGSYQFYIEADGTFCAYDATIYAKSGDIGDWHIGTGELYCGQTGINTSEDYTKKSLVNPSTTSPVRFYCGNGNRTDGKFVVLDDGSLYATAAKIEGNITANSGSIGPLQVDQTRVGIKSIGDNGPTQTSLTGTEILTPILYGDVLSTGKDPLTILKGANIGVNRGVAITIDGGSLSGETYSQGVAFFNFGGLYLVYEVAGGDYDTIKIRWSDFKKLIN